MAAQGGPRRAGPRCGHPPPPPSPGRMARRRPSPLTLSPLRRGTSTHRPWLCGLDPSAYPLCAKGGHRAPAPLHGPVQTERCGARNGRQKELRFPLGTLILLTPIEGSGLGPTRRPHVQCQSQARGGHLTDRPHTGAPTPLSGQFAGPARRTQGESLRLDLGLMTRGNPGSATRESRAGEGEQLHTLYGRPASSP